MFKLKNKHEDFISDIFGGGDGGGAEAGAIEARGAADAAIIQQQFNQQAIDELARQFGITQEQIQPFISAGTGALPGVIEGTTVSGLDERLRRIFNTDIFGELVGERERGVRGQLAAGGLTRSGTAIQEAANIPTDIGLAIENLLAGRSANLAGTGLNAALGVGSLGAGTSGGISNLLAASGQAGGAGVFRGAEAKAGGILIDAQARAAGQQNLLNLAGAFGGAAVEAGGVAPLITGFFSDVRLKENIEQIGVIGDLSLYQWDWCDFTKDTIINLCPTLGFLSKEVKENYPEFVFEFGSFEGIDYVGLLNELKSSVDNETMKLTVDSAEAA